MSLTTSTSDVSSAEEQRCRVTRFRSVSVVWSCSALRRFSRRRQDRQTVATSLQTYVSLASTTAAAVAAAADAAAAAADFTRITWTQVLS